MAVTTPSNVQDDSSSFAESALTASSSSTVPGPGAISGKFLKAVGERTLDFVVGMIIRRRLGTIQRTLEKSPDLLQNPLGASERQRMNVIYADLEELCRESAKDYYSVSVQRTAANLIQNITLITRRSPEFGTYDSPTNGQWEALLTQVRRRRDANNLLDVATNINAGLRELPPDSPLGTHIELRREPTVLMLGIEGVGKSAISRQFKSSWGTEELESYRDVIIKNTIASMQAILLDLNTLHIEAAVVEDHYDTTGNHFADVMVARDSIVSLSLDTRALDFKELAKIGSAISALWRDPAIRRAAHRAKLKSGTHHEAAFQSADYLFNVANRIFGPNYIPTREDILRSRIPTMGVHEYVLEMRGTTWRLADTSETHMRSLSHFLAPGDANVVVFVVAVTDYNKYGREKNAMQQSYESFRSLVNSPLFTTIILLFNKIDALEELMENVPMKNYLPNFTGNTPSDACEYLEKKFLRLSKGKNKTIITKFVSSFDSMAMTNTLHIVHNEVNRQYARDTGPIRAFSRDSSSWSEADSETSFTPHI